MRLRITFFTLSLLLLSTVASLASGREMRVATAGFTFVADCEDDEVVFTNTSSTTASGIVFYSWDFDDGSGSTAQNPKHTFTTPGVYQVTLTIQDSNGDTDSFTDLVTISARPTANFSINAADFCTSTTVTFTNLTTLAVGTIDSYTWDFGDGSGTVSTTDASHSYTTAGTYTVTLTATGNATCTDVVTKNVTIDPRPVVSFDIADGCFGNTLAVDNLTTITSGNLSYTWDFGDGNTSTLSNPAYEYAAAGDYDVTLTAISTDAACASDLTQAVTIHPTPVPAFTYADHCFDTPPTIVNSTTLSAGTLTYAWDFGDGNTSTDAVPARTFEQPGAYTVTLTATSDMNCPASVSDFVKVHAEPTASFVVDDACEETTVAFTNNSSILSGTMTYAWVLGDGGNSTDEEPSYSYLIPNTYNVSLTVTSNNGCTDVASQDIVIHPTTVAGTINGAQTLCSDDEATYQLELTGYTGDILRWESSSTGDEPWTVISSTSDILNYSDLSDSTWFRAIVQSGVCDVETSDTAIISIDQATVAGTLSGEATVCFNDNTGTLTLTGNVGDILEWQKSTNSGSTWSSLANTTNTFDYTNLQQDTWYRVLVKNGICSDEFSNEIKITVSPATVIGALAASGTFCKGDNSGALKLTGYTGDIIRWESSPTGDAPWASINNTTDSLEYTNLLATTYYRAVVQSGVCESIISNSVKITIDEPTVAGSLSGTTAVCEGGNAGTISLSGQTGTVQRWESSTDASTWTEIVTTNTSIAFTDLTASTYYRALVQNGVCDSAYTDELLVTVNPLPDVAFSAGSVCVGTQTQFVNASTLSSGTIVSYYWDLSGGQVSVAKDPIYRFEDAGTYAVKLIVESAAGCSDSLTNSIEVFENPVADFVFDNVCEGFEVAFTNNSTGGLTTISDYAWDFGDGTTSTLAEPGHLYATAGSYTVSLDITNANGCTDAISKTVTIYEPGQAAFSFDEVCEGGATTFSNDSNDPEDEGSYAWSFGDGNSSTAVNPQHSFASFGTYNVVLQLTTVNGCVSDTTMSVEVYEQPEAGFSADNVCFGAAISFTDTTDYSQADLSYFWDFGNGDTSTEPSPSYSYPETGKYKVEMTTTSSNGCTSSASAFFDVEPIPEVRFLIDPACQDQDVKFTNLTAQNIDGLSYAWDFGDGNTSADFEPEHVYTATGDYTATLTVTSGFGCSQSLSEDLTVFAIPQVAFSFDNVCDGFAVQFTNEASISAGSISEYLWDFGDFSNSIVLNPSKTYLNSGSYDVTLTAISDEGCTASLTQTATVYSNPVADFGADSECIGVPIDFENYSRSASSPLRYLWSFEPGAGSEAQTPSYNYGLPGTYEVQLTVTTPEGCQDSVFRNVAVFAKPVVEAFGDSQVSQGFSAQLGATGASSYIWSPASVLNNSNIPEPVARPLETTTFTVIGQSLQGCEGSDTITVTVEEDFLIEPNNTFTPDGNGKNDTWVINNVEAFGDATVRVYDRNGTLMFEEVGYQNDWDGTVGGDVLPDGTYYYVVTFASSEQIYKGTLTIIRND